MKRWSESCEDRWYVTAHPYGSSNSGYGCKRTGGHCLKHLCPLEKKMTKLDKVREWCEDNGVNPDMAPGIKEAAHLLDGDPDGMWSMLDDYGYNVGFDEVEDLMHLVNR